MSFFNFKPWGLSSAALSLLIGSPAMAATFNPTNAAEFQSALDTAEANGEDDTIQLPAATFSTQDNGDSPFYYSTSENNSLTIEGAGAGSTNLITNPDSSTSLLELYSSGSGSTANLSVSGITFEGGNSYGLYLSTSDAGATVQDSEFLANYYGLYFSSSGSISASGNLFSQNQYGAYVSGGNGSATFSNNIFEENIGSGSALQIFGSDMAIDLSQNIFQDNFSNSSSGAFYGGSSGPLRLTGNSFINNQCSGSAGAVYANSGAFTAIDNLFAENSSTGSGGALYLSSVQDEALFVNNTVTENNSSYYAGGLVLYPGSGSTTVSFYNNIFYGNSSGTYGDADDILISDDFSDVGSPILFSNNIIGEFFTYCLDDAPPCVPNVTEIENSSEDPLFLNAAAGNYNLAAGSPAIGAGDPAAPELPTVDITGRNLNNPPDLGAFAAISGLVVNPLSVNFGNTSIDVPDTQTVTLTNNGSIPVTVSAMTLSGSDGYSFDASGCGGATPTLAPGDACDLAVTFDPDSDGSFDATLTLDSDDSNQPSVAVQLLGVGVADDISGDGGCSLGASAPASAFAAWLLIPLLWGIRRFRR